MNELDVSMLDSLVQTLKEPETDEAVAAWLAKYVNAQRPFLLAHATDGVIWGKWLEGELKTAAAVAVNTASASVLPPLRGITLQQAFVFGDVDEVRLFRDELGCWQARRIVDNIAIHSLDECALLIGDKVVNDWSELGFTHLRNQVQQGLEQIIPVRITQDDINRGRRPRLLIRHFIEYDAKNGEARIGLSRLVKVGTGSAKNVEEIS